MNKCNEFLSFKISKAMSKTHMSIYDMLETRIKLEKLNPSFTMDKGYNRGVFLGCEAFYIHSGYEYLSADIMDVNNQRLSLKVNYRKLNKFLEDNDGYEFENLDQALSILALGNPIEILKSERLIERTLRHNKEEKRKQMISAGIDENNLHLQQLTQRFKTFEDQTRTIINSAHKYMTQHPTL